MPYVEKGVRASLDDGRKPTKAGELTYKLYRECIGYVSMNGRTFTTFCTVMGALICTMLEMYRRKVSVYEDEKITENGDC